MDRSPADALNVLRRVGVPIRIPTARFLLSDVLDIIDCDVNTLLDQLLTDGSIARDIGGWLTVKK